MGKIFLGLLVIAVFGMFLGGCASRAVVTSEVGDRGDQDAASGYISADDGIPLTETELAALKSSGGPDTDFSREAMDDITIQYKYFLHKGRPTFERFLRRSEAYLPYVKQVFKERGLPEELAYIAFIESGYNPAAVSRAGAVGSWQFMPFTGQKYGLSQDWWVDERRDTWKATHAAADYLAKLYGGFKDWQIAVAAYNAGEGKISRALEASGAKTFFELTRRNSVLDEKVQLKDETRQYVPRFLAVCKLMRNLEKLGFTPPDPAAAVRPAKLEAGPGTDLTAVARAADMDWTAFSAHNPAFKRHISPIDRRSALYVPEHAKTKVAAQLAGAGSRSSGGWKSYTVVKGDNWQRISEKSGVPSGILRRVNEGKQLKAGAQLRIPGDSPGAARLAENTSVPAGKKDKKPAAVAAKSAGETRKAERPAGARSENPAKPEARGSEQERVYTVKAGDTVYSVARAHGTDVETVLRRNNMNSARDLRAGQSLRVPAALASAKESGKEAVDGEKPAEIKAGAFLGASAGAREKTPPDARKERDAGGKATTSRSGEVPSPKQQAPQADGKMSVAAQAGAKSGEKKTADAGVTAHRVQEGDTMWAIARKYKLSPHELMRLNKMSGAEALRPGDTIKLAER